MPSRETLIELAAHMEWADALVWSTLLQSAAARDDAAAKGWLHHLHTVQRVFVSNWRGQPLQLTEIASFETVPALAAWGRAGVADLRAFLAAADPDTLARPVEMPWAQRFAATTGQVTHPTPGPLGAAPGAAQRPPPRAGQRAAAGAGRRAAAGRLHRLDLEGSARSAVAEKCPCARIRDAEIA